MSDVPEVRSLDNHRDACRVCKRLVLRCFDLKGKAITVENCDFGRGRIALTRDLVDQRLVASRVNQGTSYRIHGCPTSTAFSAASFNRKGGRA